MKVYQYYSYKRQVQNFQNFGQIEYWNYMRLLHLDSPEFNDSNWRAYYSLMELLQEKLRSRIANIGWEKTKKRFLSLVEADPNYYRFVIFEGHQAVGWADMNVMAANTPEQSVSVRVETANDKAGEFEQLVAAEFLRLLTRHKSETAHLMTSNQRASDIARGWSSRELNLVDHFELERESANLTVMKSWLQEIPKVNRELRLEFCSPLPEKYLVEHTKLFVNYINEMPTERAAKTKFKMSVEDIRIDMAWRAKNNVHVYTYMLFDQSEKMIAHSNAVITGDDPADVYQAMTGVNADYRGRSLSRWLKAVLFFKVGEDFPLNKTMTTDMRATNAPIQKVNAEMGYQLVSSGNEFEVSTKKLQEFLQL